ncbi:hypothetical protein LGK97_18035 [Clostridium sp. CS001]|uniref:hypothetical protein n=1 Tax=Clostridium sp. CS001 TaxID=2880648 RepID=UPI001CF1D180|nr:hypothetical protein [Clostridium sp. CS001]MCB2291616.1 hypothetical protein [Clostridium sp. CS001]
MIKRIMIGLILICMISISINVFQFYKMKDYKKQEKVYTEMFQKDFETLEKSFDLFNGSGALSNESAIKNSVSIVENLKSIRHLSLYRESRSISELLLYLSQFFVLNSDQYINENIDKVRPQLKTISKNLNDENYVKDFNMVLWKMTSKK